jgi:UDP-N-acetylenolpyruvoylglucosamine reductase
MMNTVVPIDQTQELYTELRGQLSQGTVVRLNEPLAKRTTLRVGGPADIYVEPQNDESLATVLKLCADLDTPFMVIGRGSNLLVRDGGIRGVVISLSHPYFSVLKTEGTLIHCGAGVRLREVAMHSKRSGLTGLEFMEGIPGNIGGALRMNAGAMGSATFDRVESIRYMTSQGEIIDLPSSKIRVEYRNCPLLRDHIALSAVLHGEPAPKETIEAKLKECSEKRWKSQPAAPSAGCIFKNCITIPTGRLVQELGLKGTRIGGAVVSDVHGNFIVNDRNASANDVLALIELVKERARTERGIELHTEVQIVGSD